MKNIIKIVACFVLLFILSVGKVRALVPIYNPVQKTVIEKIETVPIVVTPTKFLIKPIKDINIDIMPLATKTPTPIIVTQVVTATPNPTVSVTETKPTETEKTTVTPNPVETVTAEPTIEEVEMTEEVEEKTDSNNWFWGVIIGLLVLILIVQIWSTRKNEKKTV